MAIPTELAAAYRATCYRIFLPAGPVDLFIDQPAPAVDRWLAALGEEDYAMITAYNPASRLCPALVNERRQECLAAELAATGRPLRPGENRAVDGRWPVEPGFWIAGLPTPAVQRLGRRFGQRAVVQGRRGGVPQLVWISESE